MDGRSCSTSCSRGHRTQPSAFAQGRHAKCRRRPAPCPRGPPPVRPGRPNRVTARIDATESGHLPEHEAGASPPQGSVAAAGTADFDGDDSPPEVDAAKEENILAFCRDMARLADEMKAEDIVLLDVQGSVSWTSYFLLLTVFSAPQLGAVLARMRKEAGEAWGRSAAGVQPGKAEWEVLDFENVLVHAMSPRQREKYDLEGLYGDADRLDLQLGERVEGQWDADI